MAPSRASLSLLFVAVICSTLAIRSISSVGSESHAEARIAPRRLAPYSALEIQYCVASNNLLGSGAQELGNSLASNIISGVSTSRSGNALLTLATANATFSISGFQNYGMGLAYFAGPPAVFMVLCIIGWFFYCCIAFCPCFCCKSPDDRADGPQLPGAIAYTVFSVFVIVVAVIGLVVEGTFYAGFSGISCTIVSILDDTQYGNPTLFTTGTWLGLQGAINLLQNITNLTNNLVPTIQQQLNGSNAANLYNGVVNISTLIWMLNASMQSSGTCAGCYGCPVSTNPCGSCVTNTLAVRQQCSNAFNSLIYFNGNITSSTGLVQYSLILSQMETIVIAGFTAAASAIVSVISSGITALQGLCSQLDSFRSSLTSFHTQLTSINNYRRYAVLAIWALFLVLCLAGWTTILVAGWCKRRWFACCGHWTWCGSNGINILAFLLALFMIPLGIVLVEFCGLFNAILGVNGLSKYPTLFGTNINSPTFAPFITTCLSAGASGNILGALNITSQLGISSLTSKVNFLSTFNTTNLDRGTYAPFLAATAAVSASTTAVSNSYNSLYNSSVALGNIYSSQVFPTLQNLINQIDDGTGKGGLLNSMNCAFLNAEWNTFYHAFCTQLSTSFLIMGILFAFAAFFQTWNVIIMIVLSRRLRYDPDKDSELVDYNNAVQMAVQYPSYQTEGETSAYGAASARNY